MFADNHIHTKEFSADAKMTRNELYNFAKANPSTIVCTSEHYDYDYPVIENQLIFNTEEYFIHVKKAKIDFEAQTQRDFPILSGVEYGYMEHLGTYFDEFSKRNPFDSIICSAHYFDACDPYFDRWIYHKEKKYVYGRYLETILHALEHCNGFDIVGHFDYISRFAPYQDKKMYYKDFSDLFDAIFLKCIQNNKALEFNTRTSFQFKTEKITDYMPDPVIFSRYRELGGELITFGSDAHQLDSIMTLERDAKTFLLNAGFRHVFYYKQRKPVCLSIQD